MLTPEIKTCIEKSVLCWLATSSKENLPNVSPKEVFTFFGDDHLIIANIASPQSVRNILDNEQVAVSLIDIFVQKGFQLKGKARILKKDDPQYEAKHNLLLKMTGDKFKIASIIDITVTAVKPILAPSYILYPETREEDQVASARIAYSV